MNKFKVIDEVEKKISIKIHNISETGNEFWWIKELKKMRKWPQRISIEIKNKL
jgi:hypothetical protein